MTIIHAIILSIVEGVTEFLPVSSTGHMILLSNILKIPQTEFAKSFEIIIQFGAILSVVFLYWRKVIFGVNLWKKVFVAFLPAMGIGLVLYSAIKTYLIGNAWVVVVFLFLGGIFLLFVDRLFHNNEKNMTGLTYKDALVIGLFQTISMIPGVSRAAATIVGGLYVGLSKSEAVEFSFILAIPTMFAATVLDIARSSSQFSSGEYAILAVGFIGAFVTAYITVQTFLTFVKHHSFVPFGWYRIAVALFYIIFVL